MTKLPPTKVARSLRTSANVLGKGFAKAEMAKFFHFIDTDKDGRIDFKEFIEMTHNMGDGVNKNDILGGTVIKR